MTMDYKASVNAPDPIMPSEIPDVHIDYKGLIDYANEKGVAVSELSKEEKNQFVHDFDEIKEQNIKQQKIGQQIMAVRMIQNENKKQSSSGLTIEMLCQGMACSQEEVKKLVDYTMSFDRRFIADEVVTDSAVRRLLFLQKKYAIIPGFCKCSGLNALIKSQCTRFPINRIW